MGTKHLKVQKSRAASWAGAVVALAALTAVGVAALHHSRAHAVHEPADAEMPSTTLAQTPPAAGAGSISDRPSLPLDPSLPSASEALGRQTPANQPIDEPAQAF
ncbi:hypothetical protein BH11PSE8_BH11PSE8_46670 [soil metagenome]